MMTMTCRYFGTATLVPQIAADRFATVVAPWTAATTGSTPTSARTRTRGASRADRYWRIIDVPWLDGSGQSSISRDTARRGPESWQRLRNRRQSSWPWPHDACWTTTSHSKSRTDVVERIGTTRPLPAVTTLRRRLLRVRPAASYGTIDVRPIGEMWGQVDA
jgi:hypothetical protein